MMMRLLCVSAAAAAALLLTGCNLLFPLVRAALPFAGAKLAFSCLPESVPVDTPAGPRRAGDLTAGDTVIGYGGKPVRVLQKHVYAESPETDFLTLTFADGAAVEVCGKHRVGGVRAEQLRAGDSVAGHTVRSVTARRGIRRSCDFLTEDEGYRIGGVPVNSMIEEMHRAAATGGRSVRD